MLDPDVRRDPRMALSIAPADNPFEPLSSAGGSWLEGDAAWEIIDRLSAKYTGAPWCPPACRSSTRERRGRTSRPATRASRIR